MCQLNHKNKNRPAYCRQAIKKKEMKKVIILGACLLFAGYAQAQSPKLGIKAGLNMAKFSGDVIKDSDYNTGLSAGIFTNIPISEGFSFEPSLEYSQKGAKVDIGPSEGKMRISYIDLPLMAKYNFTPAFGIFAGPQVSFFVDQSSKLDDKSVTTPWGNNDFRKSLAGGKAGLSYNFGSVMLNASYSTDFQDLYSEKSAASGDMKNQVLNIGLAFGF